MLDPLNDLIETAPVTEGSGAFDMGYVILFYSGTLPCLTSLNSLIFAYRCSYEIFSHLINNGYIPILWDNISVYVF